MTIKNIVGIIGWPLEHSLSPAMHNAAFKELKLNSWLYMAMPVQKVPYIRIKEAVRGILALGLKGANVTVPYKENVVAYLDNISDEAQKIGAVNTIYVNNNHELCGANTDARGFINDLQAKNIAIKNAHVLVLGAGGSARAVVYGLLSEGVGSVAILNRTKTKADDLALSFKDVAVKNQITTDILNKDAIKKIPHADLVINTTSLGMGNNVSEMPWDENIHFSKSQCVYDLIYNPKKTKLLEHAHKDNAQIYNGLGMLVEQGALSFTIWTGQEAPKEAMLFAVKSIATT